jgi:6-pyruvoyl-tetrahydropterin synthase
MNDKKDKFVILVKEMRTAQKEYFRTRDKGLLNKSKRLEKEVDEAIEVMPETINFADLFSTRNDYGNHN